MDRLLITIRLTYVSYFIVDYERCTFKYMILFSLHYNPMKYAERNFCSYFTDEKMRLRAMK